MLRRRPAKAGFLFFLTMSTKKVVFDLENYKTNDVIPGYTKMVTEATLTYRQVETNIEFPIVSSFKNGSNAALFIRKWYEQNGMSISDVEYFGSLLLNRANKLIAVVPVSKGGIMGTVADPRIILGSAIILRASAIILFHNHPSGNLSPSEQDNALTRRLKEAGAMHEIYVLDHIILTESGHYSFADEGKL